MVETMARERVSGFSGVPSTFLLLLNRVPLADYDLSSLRYLTQAGGAMAPATARRLHEAIPQAELYIMYGQTEATARLAWLPPARREEKSGSVGIFAASRSSCAARRQQPDAFEVGDARAWTECHVASARSAGWPASRRWLAAHRHGPSR
jgi:acyl-coenzyme A synthetase/AMP-(fatty) acid ligase